MTDLKKAYKHLIDSGVSQKLILRRLKFAGIKPSRSQEYSRTQLTRMVNEGYAVNPEAETEILKMYDELMTNHDDVMTVS